MLRQQVTRALRRSTAYPATSSRSFASATASELGPNFNLSDEQQAFQDLARDFTKEQIIPIAAEHDRTMKFPWEVVKQAHAAGLMNLHVPEEYGGPGLSVLSSAVVSEEIAYGCAGIATALEANGLASAPVIVAGNEEQKKKYLGMLAEEPLMAAYGVTEPGAGSDVASITTRATKEGDKYVINGSKLWITNAGVSSWLFVLACTDPTAKPNKRMSGFIVPSDTPGVSFGSKLINMGQRCSDTRPVNLDNVVIGKENLLGAEGDGFKIAMQAFDITRPLVAAGAVGLAQRALAEAAKFAHDRKTFGKPIIEHQAIAFMLADMAIGVESSRALVWKASAAKDVNDKRTTYYASLAKALASYHAWSNADKCVQAMGGSGYNEEYIAAKLLRDSRIYRLYEGTDEIQRLIISRVIANDYKDANYH